MHLNVHALAAAIVVSIAVIAAAEPSAVATAVVERKTVTGADGVVKNPVAQEAGRLRDAVGGDYGDASYGAVDG